MLKKCFLILTSLSLITMVTFTTIVQEDLKLLKEQTFTVQSGGNLTVKAGGPPDCGGGLYAWRKLVELSSA